MALSSDSAKTPNEGDFSLTPLGIHAHVLGHVEITEPPSAGNPDPSLDGLVHGVLHVVEILSNRVVSKETRLGNRKSMLTSKNLNQYALVPAKKNGFPSKAKFWCTFRSSARVLVQDALGLRRGLLIDLIIVGVGALSALERTMRGKYVTLSVDDAVSAFNACRKWHIVIEPFDNVVGKRGPVRVR